MAETFRTWIGRNYNEGIANGDGGSDTVVVVGIQHYCIPRTLCSSKYTEIPFSCLKEHNTDCFAWTTFGQFRDDCVCRGQDDMPKPIGCDDGGCPGKKLECETLISITEHILENKATMGSTIFNDVEICLYNLYRRREGEEFKYEFSKKEKKELWSKIIFFNYVQHYTRLLSRRDLITPNELEKTPKKDENNFHNIIDNYKPSVIIVMDDLLKGVYECVKGIISKNYKELKILNISGCHVFADEGSSLYRQHPYLMNEFIRRGAELITGKQTVKKLRNMAEVLIDKFPNECSTIKDACKKIVPKIKDEDAKNKLKDWETKRPTRNHKSVPELKRQFEEIYNYIEKYGVNYDEENEI